MPDCKHHQMLDRSLFSCRKDGSSHSTGLPWVQHHEGIDPHTRLPGLGELLT